MAEPRESDAVLLHGLLAQCKDEEYQWGYRDGPPAYEGIREFLPRNECGREDTNVREVGVYVRPADPEAQTVFDCEPNVERRDVDAPENLDERHRHQTEILRGRQSKGGRLKVLSDYDTIDPESAKGEPCDNTGAQWKHERRDP